MDVSFWRDKKVLITGHTGFKGSWLALWLQKLGAEVIGYSLDPISEPNLFNLAQVYKFITHIKGDVCDSATLQKIFNAYQPDIIFHMAAQSLVRVSYEDPIATYATNVMGTVNVLEIAKKINSIKAIINVTSDKCYENKEEGKPYTEGDRLGGVDPYSNSKACAELVTVALRESFYKFREPVCGVATARAGNVIGGGDWATDRLIPDIMRSVLNDTELLIRYPHALRPWQHVLEALAGYLTLASKLVLFPNDFTGSWNFGPNEQNFQTVSMIIDNIEQIFQKKLRKKFLSTNALYEAAVLKLDSTKARTQLAWKPYWDLTVSLKKTVEWYQAFLHGEDLCKKTQIQIDEYMSLL